MPSILRACCLILFGTILPSFMWAQAGATTTPPKAVLKEGDIERFMETYPKLEAEFEALDGEWEDADFATALSALEANAEVQAILDRYGWDAAFFSKLEVIVRSMALLEIEAQLAELPEGQRAMAERMMAGQLGALEVHSDDLAEVRSKRTELTAFFDAAE